MKLFYDLHLHSCLSPCGSEDMTPADLAAMCALAGLDIVALTDHNTCGNCAAFCRAAEARGLLALEIYYHPHFQHLLPCLFQHVHEVFQHLYEAYLLLLSNPYLNHAIDHNLS